MRCLRRLSLLLGCLGPLLLGGEEPRAPARAEEPARAALDAPLLFVKQFNYLGIHIYDTYYKWRPGGGIYVLENPADPPARHRVRPVIDPATPETLGGGIYSHPDLSWDAKRVLFCHKAKDGGSTSIYEIGVDGKGLRRLTDPSPTCSDYRGSLSGQHDVAPAYLPDGRIVFTSTRPSGLVPCFNSGVNILHVMNADGSGIHPISVNNVNEFDPSVLPDGRVLYGRWEYVDKTALTQQSVWTIFPDGTSETALFANNMVFPEAVLDARAVPGSGHLIVGTFAPHNSPPRGSIAFIDPRLGKNDPQAIIALEHPGKPTHDRGESCEPWPLSEDLVLYSGMPAGAKLNAIMLLGRDARKTVVHAEPDTDCHNPILVKPRPCPPVLASNTAAERGTGRFFVQDVYEGLDGVKRGEVKWLRVIEETSRVSPACGGNPFNQTFLVSCALAFSAKNFLGLTPVEADGSAYFEAPSGRALYLQALDAEGRMVRGMRTFVSAAPGTTRSCVGCHEFKYGAPPPKGRKHALEREPDCLQPEAWGSGFVDYPGMVQPVLDKHCISCHGGEKGFDGGLDLTGGWTEFFNISYENLTARRHTQLTAHLIAGIDCMNGTSLWSSRIFPPRGHGSGAAPLAEALVSGHKGYSPNLSRAERDLLLAWIDTNGLYHGSWDYSPHGCSVKAWGSVKNALAAEMNAAGCLRCHGNGNQPAVFEDDWFNLQRPELSRILRAPLAPGDSGLGAGLCRETKIDPQRQRVRLLWNGYAHAVQPLEAFKARPFPPPPSPEAKPVATFASAQDPHYQEMLRIIRDGRRQALAAPRVDMPGAEVLAGTCRQLLPLPLPEPLPVLKAEADAEGVVRLAWERSARTIGLIAEVHRGSSAGFAPARETLLATTRLFEHTDANAQPGAQQYALVFFSGDKHCDPIRAAVTVPPPPAPPAPAGLIAVPAPGRVDLRWKDEGVDGAFQSRLALRYCVYRAQAGTEDFKSLTAQPIAMTAYSDTEAGDGGKYAYTVRAVNRRGTESVPATFVVAAALPEVKEPVFVAAFSQNVSATLHDGAAATGKAQGKAGVADGVLDVRQGGCVTFDHRPEFDLGRRLSVECWVYFAQPGEMPVVVSCGLWNQAGWFLQRLGGVWRWHVGGMDCDGGKPAPGRWIHMAGTFDGQMARLFEDGKLAAEKSGAVNRAPWAGALHVGQYSGAPGPPFQVTGCIAGVKVYSRVLSTQEALAAQQAGPPSFKP